MSKEFRISLLAFTALASISSPMMLESANAQQSYYTRYFATGDSLTDNGRISRETNGFSPVDNFQIPRGFRIYENGIVGNEPPYSTVVSKLIGLPNILGNNLAVGGATSVHQDPDPAQSPGFAWGCQIKLMT